MMPRGQAVLRAEVGVALAVIAGLWALASCTADAPGGQPGESSATSPSDQSASSASEPPQDRIAEIEFARAEVSERFGHPLEEVDLVSVESVVWPDSSLGCPRTERTYTPTDIAGYRIVLRWERVEFSYHGADGSMPFHCMFLDG